MKRIALIAAAMTIVAPPAWATENSDLGVILQRYADDYRSDPMLVDAHFGIRVGEAWWTIVAKKGAGTDANSVDLVAGQPEAPTWYYTIESGDVLRRLDRGEVTFGTLAGKARQSDRVAVDAEFMPGYADQRVPGSDFYEQFTTVSFHFWYRGNPEIVPYGSQEMRLLHGVDLTALYYEPGLRTLFFSIKRGQHANQDGDGVGPWKKMMIFTQGAGKAKIGDRVIDVRAGERLFVPPDAINEFWNDAATPLEGVLIIFGEGA